MKIYDISMTITEDMMVYNNIESKKPTIKNVASFENSSHYENDVTMNIHTGTHIDAPLHMIENGETMAIYKVEDFVTEARVIDLTKVNDCITREDLVDKDIQKGDFILFKTKNSFDEVFNLKYIYLERTGAKYLKDIGIKGVGIDTLGIERAQSDHSTHKQLLGNGIMIVEGLQLKDIEEGDYQLIVLPIKLLETEGAPARAILIEQ